jgi:hypothetical protein
LLLWLITKKIIKEISENLDCGFDCYYNIKSYEIVTIPSISMISDEEEFREVFGEELKRIDGQKSDSIKFEDLESFEAFKIMERFTEQLPENLLKIKLENVLRRKKPFQNFNHAIHNSVFRQQWFDFKLKELEKIVEFPSDRGKVNE